MIDRIAIHNGMTAALIDREARRCRSRVHRHNAVSVGGIAEIVMRQQGQYARKHNEPDQQFGEELAHGFRNFLWSSTLF